MRVNSNHVNLSHLVDVWLTNHSIYNILYGKMYKRRTGVVRFHWSDAADKITDNFYIYTLTMLCFNLSVYVLFCLTFRTMFMLIFTYLKILEKIFYSINIVMPFSVLCIELWESICPLIICRFFLCDIVQRIQQFYI